MIGPWGWVEQQAHNNLSTFALRVLITLVALGIIILAWTVSNKWALAGILAYEILP